MLSSWCKLKMNKNGKVAVEILIMLVTIVVTSAIIFLLIQGGAIKVKGDYSDVSVLNTEFIPMGREGYLSIREFTFCKYIDEAYQCIGPGDNFDLGGEVHFRFFVESSIYEGNIKLVKNYRITGPDGAVLLNVDENNNFYFDGKSNEEKEFVTFKDYFFVGEELLEGEYTLDLIVENPLLNKKTTLSQKFLMNNLDYMEGNEEI
jgi:hypothetical protein